MNVIPANRRTAEAQALAPYLQVDLMLLLPITGEINLFSTSLYSFLHFYGCIPLQYPIMLDAKNDLLNVC